MGKSDVLSTVDK